jgi:hypothetical protein
MKRAALALAAVVLLYAAPARARTPEIALDPRDGVWIAQDDKFIFQTLDRWTVFDAGATVNKLVVDQSILWLATDDGVIRFDIGSQRFTKLTMDDGLPSQRVSTVAFDDQYVWFGTNKGLVRYRKTDRALKVYDESNGLPSKVVTYSVAIGRQVWFGTRAGIAVFSPDVDGLRAFGEADGMASGDVAELFQFGNDLWCRTDVGLSRFRIQQRVFNNFPMTLMRAQQIRVITIEGENLWLGTDNGLWQFEGASDAIRIFPQQAALGSQTIVGVETTSSYLYFTTDKEILQYNKLTLGIRRFTAAEGLRRQEGSTGTLSSTKFVTVMFPDAAVVFNIQLDQWTERKIAVTVANERKTTGRIFGQLELEQPLINGTRDTSSAYANAIGGIGIGQQLEKDRTLNGSVYLDYGQLNAGGIRDLQYKIEYLGNQNDVVRDVRIEDKLKYRYVEEGLDRQLLLQGAHVGMATPGAEPKAKLEVDVGFRRGQVVRDFLTGPWQEIYQLSQKYILSGTERVYVDGELLNNGTDYTMVYSAGQLTFLDRERIDDLSVITIEYERDLMPKKSLGALSLQARLPVSNEIGTWVLAGTPTMVSTDTGLYSQLDGGAPKYIDRGWIAGVFATYQQSGGSLQAWIQNMGTPDNAQTIFNFDLPNSRLTISTTQDPKNPNDPNAKIPNAVVDIGLPTSYKAFAFVDQYYIEVSIDDRSDAALVYVKTFTLQILNRATQAGSNLGDQFKEMLVAARAAVAPVKGMEIGVRAAQLQQMSDSNYVDGENTGRVPATHLTTGAVDGRYQTQVGKGGLLTSYAEMGGSHDSNGGRPDGLAGMGFLRLSSSRLEGSISGRLNTEGWTPIGHTTPSLPQGGTTQRTWNDARMGTLRDQAQFNVTGYPLTWLPVTALFTRQRAWLTDGSEGTGVLQHAIARVQLNKAGLPATTLQFGSTELDNPNAFQTHRLQGSAQTDYDLARVLSFTHIKRFNVRALYSLSQAETDQDGKFAYGDRVQLIRLEGKLSPTSTESINALFRSRDVGHQTDVDGPYRRSIAHWELLSGAQSNIIPGLVPKLNYNLFYDDNRMPSTSQSSSSTTTTTTTTSTADSTSVASSTNLWTNTGAAGSAVTPPGPGPLTLQSPTRTVTGTIGGGLGIYPGQWWPKLGPLAFSPSVAVGDSEKSENFVKTEYSRVYDYVGSEVWAGRKLEMSFYQRYRYTTTGADAHENASMTVLQNRIVYRPIFTSPITLLANYEGDRNLNTNVPKAGPWATKDAYQNTLEWLRRWSQVITTRTRAFGNFEKTSETYHQEANQENSWLRGDHTKYTFGGELQFRFYPLSDVSALYIYGSTAFYRVFCNGDDSFQAWQLVPTTGVIWRMGDRIYLDGHFNYDYLHCLSGASTACTTTAKISPYVYFTMNL